VQRNGILLYLEIIFVSFHQASHDEFLSPQDENLSQPSDLKARQARQGHQTELEPDRTRSTVITLEGQKNIPTKVVGEDWPSDASANHQETLTIGNASPKPITPCSSSKFAKTHKTAVEISLIPK
jgi:hypothetical protein